MSAHPKLDEAIKRGEIQQCPHCQSYWVAACHIHECLPMVRFQREQLRADLKRAVGLLSDCVLALADVEYADNSDNEYRAACPSCGHVSADRHGHDCALNATIKETKAFLAEHKDEA